jgi:hypothetical protein
MGKIIQFPRARIRRRRQVAGWVFADFGELALLERAQLKLFAACATYAVLLTAALHLSSQLR